MLTTSEIAVTGAIWVLTGTGAFFALRAAWRRRKEAVPAKKPAAPPRG